MAKNALQYDPIELDSQIQITKTKIEFAKKDNDVMAVNDLNCLLRTLVKAKNATTYYTTQSQNIR